MPEPQPGVQASNGVVLGACPRIRPGVPSEAPWTCPADSCVAFNHFPDGLIPSWGGAVAPDLQQVVGQTHQPPFPPDLLQAPQPEAAEASRPFDLTEARLGHPLAHPNH